MNALGKLIVKNQDSIFFYFCCGTLILLGITMGALWQGVSNYVQEPIRTEDEQSFALIIVALMYALLLYLGSLLFEVIKRMAKKI